MAVDLREKAKARLARESGAVVIDRAARVRFALAFPNVYRVGMASLGFQLVHGMLNALPNASCERVFLPDPNDLKEHLRTKTELFTLESQSPLAEFDVVAFSLSFELDYLNVLRMLQLSGIPIRGVERDETRPLVIAGGICATFNPEPLADFVDAFVIGDAENVLPDLVRAVEAARDAPREDQLAALSGVPGAYVPKMEAPSSAPRVVKRNVATNLHQHPNKSVIRTPDAEFGEVQLVETARGCGRGCRFCVAGFVNRPPRVRKVENAAGGTRLGLVGAAVFDRCDVEEMCRRIVASGSEFTVSSVRLETVTPALAKLMAQGGQKTLTIAPEAGSERLRRVIKKHCTGQAIFEAVSAATDAGIDKIKLYFMIGLPTETDADVEAIVNLMRPLAQSFPTVSFQVSVSSFVPKPWTPFQWHPMEREGVLKKRYAALRNGISSIGGVSFSGESPRLSMVQGILARGDRRLGRVLAAALDNGGDYPAALRDTGTVAAWYIYRQRGRDEVLTWDHIDVGLSKDYLWREYQEALNG